ncbi:MAG: ATP-dependent DNA helicase RecG [Erysipelotrichaceae bacterium]|nr:ATP-dependent DNA helicase RecG [Erysipelotrichaceae bacterium]
MELKELKLTDKRKQICEKLGLNNSDDILNYYPFRYEMYESIPYDKWNVGSQITFVGTIASYPSTFRKGRLVMSRFKVLVEEELINITIFNRPWINNLHENDEVTIIGKYDGNNKVTASNYYTRNISGEIIPVYNAKEGISQNEIKKLIMSVYSKVENTIEDHLPQRLINEHKLINYKDAIYNIHFPTNRHLLSQSLSRLKYEEFLRFYTAIELMKEADTDNSKDNKSFDNDKIDRFISSLSFELTSDQDKAVKDIINDLRSNKVMYRLLQGDVGCGKTAVAMVGLYANYLAGYQGALMAPTEILAKQHYDSLSKTLSTFGVKVGLLYGSMDDQRKVKEAIRNNEYDVIVGTHALFSKDVEYEKLGLVIADEQHRFGVKQRQALKEKGRNCDFLLMSATPIPRTLASSLFGDMDVSTIETMPSGRKGCITTLIRKNSIVPIMNEIKKELENGRQVYLIGAAIEKNENYSAKDIEGLYDSLKEIFLPYKVGMIHGKMSSEEKDQIMNDFSDNRFQVLISTTVVEVGVNVPNATVMVIYDSDKFGLSQIHQLRGRVQRSSYQGYCYLLTDSSDENTLKRLEVLVKSNNGFEISMEDLKIRGPGDILGTRQSGVPGFILGNIIEDTRFIDAARKDADYIMNNLDDEDNRKYYDYIAQIAIESVRG